MKKSAANLFEAARLSESAPRPLADRLRPKTLDEVIGQDHLLGEHGILRRMVKARSEEHTSELQSQFHLVCRLLLEKKKKKKNTKKQVKNKKKKKKKLYNKTNP